MKKLRTRLWHYFLIVMAAVIIAELAWYAANPSEIGGGFLVGIILIAVTIIYSSFDQRWKRIW